MLQTKFSQGPYFEQPQPILTIKMKHLGKSITTRKVFTQNYSETFGQNFTDAIAKDRKVPLQTTLLFFLTFFVYQLKLFLSFVIVKKQLQ